MNLKHFNFIITLFVCNIACLQEIQAKPLKVKTVKVKASKIKTAKADKVKTTPKKYVKKTMYEGLGKKSKANGLIKAKGISGHWKGNPAKGYKFVSAYSKSK